MQESAGILGYKKADKGIMFFLVHPGGPFFAKKDLGFWTIPKGLIEKDEDPLQAAIREFAEEVGFTPEGNFMPLGSVKQKGGKMVHAFALAFEFDSSQLSSNTFTIEWPPRSGKMASFAEVDRAEWFDLATAQEKINPAQADFLLRLLELEKNS
ncbi:NUDIX domain-containing protein [Pedobacter sp. KR3-3]|uniref:NUDIX domain-containing protein n=1 Tax=Pedobacter albus TaxID=3113905 RepID=A0ABU7I3E2_9SPHI|nr:NUDIX domain-containing protein [Pedobacter sp. KR3-3]MEE1943980.1 NUDIX domain-containing protein [Pedobacter sp. KR3-3]